MKPGEAINSRFALLLEALNLSGLYSKRLWHSIMHIMNYIIVLKSFSAVRIMDGGMEWPQDTGSFQTS